MYRKTPFVEGETYHVYNRGAHKQDIFTSMRDYKRFMLLMYLANNSEPIHLSNLLTSKKYQGESLLKIYEEGKSDKSLVDIYCYSLMPNHFHLVLSPLSEKGLTVFMRKFLTGYSMYFNTKYDHSGVLFQGPFKSRHINTNEYFRYIFAYIHLNPLELHIPDWKEKGIKDSHGARTFMKEFPYSSFHDYHTTKRPERNILSIEKAPDFLKGQNDLEILLEWFQQGESLLK